MGVVLAITLLLTGGALPVVDPPRAEVPMSDSPPTKGGPDRLVPCTRCRAPVFMRKGADGKRTPVNPDGTPHECKARPR